MQLAELRRALKQHRLELGWSYDELAADIAKRTGRPVSSAAVRRQILGQTGSPRATTKFQLERYLTLAAPSSEAAAS